MCRREFLIGQSNVKPKDFPTFVILTNFFSFGLSELGGKMKSKILFIIGALAFAVFIGGFVYAGGMGGGGMGGGGRGMMGGGHMMDYGSGYSAPYPAPYNRDYQSEEPYRYNPQETKRLRQEIRGKRQELSKLYDSEKPDKALIDKKIDELSKLEAKLDYRLSGSEYQRR
jgi:hypothetical protein